MIKKITPVILIILFLFCHRTEAQQEILYLDAVNPIFSITFPDDWIIEKKEKEWILKAMPKDNAIIFYTWDIKAKSLEEAGLKIKANVSQFLSKIKVTKNEDYKSKNITFKCFSGTGTTKDKKNVNVLIYLFQRKTKIIGILCYGNSNKIQENKGKINEILNSIFPK